MFIRFTSVLLIIALFSTSFTPLIFYAGYALNQNYIAKVLCENKAKPKLQCKGKCYLSKKIKQAEEKEEKQGSSSFKKNLEVFVNPYFTFRCFTFQTDEYPGHFLQAYYFSTAYKFFQPPRV